MDTEILVDEKVEDGAALIGRLMRRKFDVTVAFWVKIAEDSSWRLYIASSSFTPETRSSAYVDLYATLGEIAECSITPMDVTILSSTDPTARDAMALRDRSGFREPKLYRGKRMGTTDTAEVCIYPRRFPMKIRRSPDGAWQVLISEPDEVWLTCDFEDEARTIAAAPVLEYEGLAQIRSGEQFAGELEKTADALLKYHISFGFLVRRAQEGRHESKP